MPVPQYLSELKAMQQSPSAAGASSLVNMLRAEPQLAAQARPLLTRDPVFAPAYRVLQPGADYEYHNTRMPMPRAQKSPGNLDTLLRVVQDAADQRRTLKAMGDGWGFANAADTPDWLVHCLGLDAVLPLEDDTFLPTAPPANSLVRFQAGITFEKLNRCYRAGPGGAAAAGLRGAHLRRLRVGRRPRLGPVASRASRRRSKRWSWSRSTTATRCGWCASSGRRG